MKKKRKIFLDTKEETETLWAIPRGADVYIIDNIPFLSRGYSLGDIVKTKSGKDGEKVVIDIIEHSDNSTVWVTFKNESKEQATKACEYFVHKWQCSYEGNFNFGNLASINIPPTARCDQILNYLYQGYKKRLWSYQESRISYTHQKHLGELKTVYRTFFFKTYAGLEAILGRKEGKNYVIESIPYFAYGYSYQDLIKARMHKNGTMYAEKVLVRSQNSTIRLFVSDTRQTEEISKILRHNHRCNTSVRGKLIALSIPYSVSYPRVKNYLEQGESQQAWEYEEGYLSKVHRKQF